MRIAIGLVIVLGVYQATPQGLSIGNVALASETPIEISWKELIPKSENSLPPQIPEGLVQHGQLMTPIPEDLATRVTSEYNGRSVRIPGYIVPLEFDGTGTTEFLLVPYVGACVHVPPPPANQLIIVTTQQPYEFDSMFEPVYVTGIFNTAAVTTDLADVGYTISADMIDRYE